MDAASMGTALAEALPLAPPLWPGNLVPFLLAPALVLLQEALPAGSCAFLVLQRGVQSEAACAARMTQPLEQRPSALPSPPHAELAFALRR